MAKFNFYVPKETLKEFKQIYDNADEIFGAMTRAGAEVVYSNIVASAPPSFKNSKIMDCLTVTVTYHTPSDGGINTKVAFYGYFENHNGQTVPAELVCNVYEHGASGSQKRPFIRKCFNKSAIEDAMLEAQRKASGGLLE